MTIKGIVIQKQGHTFIVHSGNENYECFSLKKVKNDNEILVGDIVEFENENNVFVIEQIEERKNKLTRPFVVNVTKLFILICEVPETDFVLVDKLIIDAKINNIEPILVINKCDINSKEYVEKVKEIYKQANIKILEISTKTSKNIDILKQEFNNNLSCLCGQSAVGKSSLINCILNKNQTIGEYSKKLRKGRNTTTSANIFVLDENSFLIDTPGFSKISLNLDCLEIQNFYPEILKFSKFCYYSNCTHITEGNKCEVIKNLNEINDTRYSNYKKIYEECLNNKNY